MSTLFSFDADPSRRFSRGGVLDAAAMVRETLSRTLGRAGHRQPPLSPRSVSTGRQNAFGTEDAGLSFPLRDMIARLSALKPCVPLCETSFQGRPQPDVACPEGASFEERVFRGAAGSLGYRLYVPSAADGRAMPLVVMLHGCTQSAEDFAAGTHMNAVAEEQGFLVAYPRQTQAANLQKCWNWFEAKNQRRGSGEAALMAELTREIMRDHAVDPARVYVAGLSAGGAAAAILGQAYPDLYAAVGVHSGLAAGAASDMPSAFSAMRQGSAPAHGQRPVPTIVFHGDGDRTVHPQNGNAVLAQASGGASLHADTLHGQAPGGLDYTVTRLSDDDGRPMLERWILHGAGHAWSGGSPSGSYTEPRGPDASREMMRFFLQHASAGIAP